VPEFHTLRTELSRSIGALRESVNSKGLVRTGARVAAVAGGQLALPVTRMLRAGESFTFRSQRLPYTLERYNNSFLNERAVEISIAKWFLARAGGGRMLEVGNVLAHYGVTGHMVLDKYETIPGVINEDVVDFVPEKPFDTIVAISTLEHVGWDEEPRDPDKVFRAIDHLRSCLAAGGRMLVTVPIGHNDALDAGLRDGAVKFADESWLVRTNRRNDWVETDRERALGRKYGHPYTGANAIYVGMTAPVSS